MVIITLSCHVSSAPLVSFRSLMLTQPSKWFCYLSSKLTDFPTWRYMGKLKRNEIKVRASDFPSLLYHKDGYDSDNVEAKLLQNPIALRVSHFAYCQINLDVYFLVLSFHIHIAGICNSRKRWENEGKELSGKTQWHDRGYPRLNRIYLCSGKRFFPFIQHCTCL